MSGISFQPVALSPGETLEITVPNGHPYAIPYGLEVLCSTMGATHSRVLLSCVDRPMILNAESFYTEEQFEAQFREWATTIEDFETFRRQAIEKHG